MKTLTAFILIEVLVITFSMQDSFALAPTHQQFSTDQIAEAQDEAQESARTTNVTFAKEPTFAFVGRQ